MGTATRPEEVAALKVLPALIERARASQAESAREDKGHITSALKLFVPVRVNGTEFVAKITALENNQDKKHRFYDLSSVELLKTDNKEPQRGGTGSTGRQGDRPNPLTARADGSLPPDGDQQGPRTLSQDRLSDAPKNAEAGKRIEKGAISFAEDGKAVLHALQAPDVSTAVHELAHLFRRTLTPVEQAMIARWAGAKQKNTGEWAWGRASEEKFARGFERYLRDGTAPNKPLQRIFSKLRDWMRSIYESIKGSAIDIQITPEVRALFDRMLTPKDSRQAQTLEEGIRSDENRASQSAPQTSVTTAPAKPVAQVEETRVKSGQSSTPVQSRESTGNQAPAHTPDAPKPTTTETKAVQAETKPAPPETKPAKRETSAPGIGRTTPEQEARADEQRPELANPGRTDDVRKLVREAREKMADPVRKAQEQSVADGKRLLAEPDKLAALRAKVAAGEPLNDIETAAFTELLDREGGTAITEGGARLKQTIEAIQGYTRGGTEQARALAMRRDRNQTPEERRKSALIHAILMPSRLKERAMNEERARIEKATPSQKKIFQRVLDRLLAKEVERVEKFKKRMKTLGYDLDNLDALYQKDEAVAAIVDEARIDKADGWDAAYEWWMSSILSGLKTSVIR